MQELTTSLTLEGIERRRGRSLMFHAAGLADPVTGSTAALVAASGTGKTTATRRLGRTLAYVTDETVCVDPDELSIVPYPKPLSVVRRPGEPKEQVSPDELGLLPLDATARLNALLLLERSPDEQAPTVTEPLPLVTALSTLVPNISALPSLPRPLETLLRVIDACGGVRAVRYREIDDVAESIARIAASPAVPTVRREPPRAWSPDPAAATATEDTAGATSNAVALGPWVEALENPEDPSQVLVLLPEQLVVLAGIAPVLWHECRERGPLSLDALTDALVASYGSNPEARQLTRECVGRLRALEVLQPEAVRGAPAVE
ncbi:hypothetical protein [Kocuria rhizophila]|uniref:hypothetical protein n=1 Tax=Kocuria rhizophila TaxID=72000 RepID=UPI0032AF471E